MPIIYFNCPNYPNVRIAMFNATQIYHPLNIEKLLFGYDNLTVQENTTILLQSKIILKVLEDLLQSNRVVMSLYRMKFV